MSSVSDVLILCSWKHVVDLACFFLRINRSWGQQLSYDDWATCRTLMLRVIATRPDEAVLDPEDRIFTRNGPKVLLFVRAPSASWPPVAEYGQEFLRFEGAWRDSPRRSGAYYHGEAGSGSTTWVDVGTDIFNDTNYIPTSGPFQNRPPPFMAPYAAHYWEDPPEDFDGFDRPEMRVPAETGPGAAGQPGPVDVPPSIGYNPGYSEVLDMIPKVEDGEVFTPSSGDNR